MPTFQVTTQKGDRGKVLAALDQFRSVFGRIDVVKLGRVPLTKRDPNHPHGRQPVHRQRDKRRT